jgi:hypothetical protein
MKALKLFLLSAAGLINSLLFSGSPKDIQAGELAEEIRAVCISSVLMNAPDQISRRVLYSFCSAMNIELRAIESIVRHIGDGDLDQREVTVLSDWFVLTAARVRRVMSGVGKSLQFKKRGKSDLLVQFAGLGKLLREYLHYLLARSLLKGWLFNFKGDLETGIGAQVVTCLETEGLDLDMIKTIGLVLCQWGSVQLPTHLSEHFLMGDEVSAFYDKAMTRGAKQHPLMARIQKAHGRPRWIGLDGPEHRISGTVLSLFIHHCLSDNYYQDIDFLNREYVEVLRAPISDKASVEGDRQEPFEAGGSYSCKATVGKGASIVAQRGRQGKKLHSHSQGLKEGGRPSLHKTAL